jgi:Family of unknown function (DUF6768)
MNELDDKIRAALAAEAAEFSPRAVEPPLLEQVIDTFRGRSRWLVTLVFVMITVWTVAAVVTAYEFFQADGERAMLAWAAGFGVSIVAIAMLKIWYWMELAKFAVLREVKRVELRIVRLGQGV